MAHETSFLSLLVVLLLAFSVPILLLRFRRLGIPIVVGEIFAGMIVGRSGLKLVPEDDPLLSLLAEFGFVFLMFLAGLEVDFTNLRRLDGARGGAGGRSMGPVSLGLLLFLMTLALSACVGFLLVRFGLALSPWMVALILSTTSLGVVMPVLKERGLSSGRFGQSILVAALIADFGTMLLITVLVAVTSRGLTVDILVIGLLFVVFFLLYQLGLFSTRVKGVRRTIEELSHATAQIKVRAAFAIMLVFIVLSQALGTEIILGAFLAGAALSLMRTPDDVQVAHQLEAIGFGFFVPLFFIQVGIQFDLAALIGSPSALLLLPILILAAIAVKLIPGLLFRLIYSWREAFGAGSLLSARLSLIIAASAVGLRLGLIGETMNSAMILVAVITVTLAPLAFTRLIDHGAKAECRRTVIFGANELGLQVARQLVDHNEPVLVVDPDERATARARQHGLESLAITPFETSARLASCLETASTLLCVHGDSQMNYAFSERARATFGVDNVLVSVADPGEVSRFERLGAKPINATLAQATLLALVTRNPATYALLTRTDDDKEVWEVAVGDGPHLGTALHQLALPGDVLVLAVRRDGHFLVPHGETRLVYGDRLTLVGSLEWVESARAVFGSEGIGAGDDMASSWRIEGMI
jgi:Kef-type K+ transport system membrane component KefB/Trk K+ transport system NAD-binding subunit